MAEQYPVITDEGIAKLKKWIGVKHPALEQFNKYATKDAIRHFAWGIGDTNPLFNDEEYGPKTRWGCMIAPLSFLTSTHRYFPHEGLPGIHSMWSGMEFECFLPIKEGDRIYVNSWLSDVIEKTRSAFSKKILLQGWGYEFKNQNKQTMVEGKEWLVRTERGTAKERGKYSALTPAHYTKEELKAIDADLEKEVIRGATPRYWEDVVVGEEIPHVVKGPLSTTDIIAWMIGWGYYPYTRAHGNRVDYVRRHPGIVMTNEYGAPDVPERVHWDNEYAQRAGVPRAYDIGPQRVSWMCQTVTNWMGDDGFIEKLSARVTRFNLEGDTTWCHAKINRKYVENGKPLVELELWAIDQRKEITASGSAVVLLPTKAK